jgi:hypothetical protein
VLSLLLQNPGATTSLITPRYRLDDRLADPNPVLTWTVSRYRDRIRPGDTAFLWGTGEGRGIRAVMRIDQAPRDMPELETEQPYWAERDPDVRTRVGGTLRHRAVGLSADDLRRVPGLEGLSVFRGFQQATNFAVSEQEGAILLALAAQGGRASRTARANGRGLPVRRPHSPRRRPSRWAASTTAGATSTPATAASARAASPRPRTRRAFSCSPAPPASSTAITTAGTPTACSCTPARASRAT